MVMVVRVLVNLVVTVVVMVMVMAVLATVCNAQQQSSRVVLTDATDELLQRYPDQGDDLGPQQGVLAGLGGRANLPCNITSPLSNEPALLVLWYKSGIYKPIYSLDLRSDPPTHWRNPSLLGSRATFHPSSHTLILQRVRAEDRGAYRCKVSFKTSPTLTFITNLTVIVPPRRLAVYTDLGMEARNIVGPFSEGSTLSLTCRATGGSPPPTVTWWEGPALLDMTSEVERLDQVSNTLVVPSLTRRDLHRTLTCQAANSNITAPLLTTVTLDMNFPPLWVRLQTNREALSAGREYTVKCRAAGARPTATLTWRLGATLLKAHSVKKSEEGNVTTSELSLTPEVSDAGKILSCGAHSPALPSRSLMDHWRLDVHYVPLTILRPGRSLNLTTIEEGDDVYFECSIKANPRAYKIVWLHEERSLQHNVTGGVIISNQSLVLQRVTRAASGKYYCVASNTQGDGKSNPVPLKVKYAPVCQDPQVTYHGAARMEQVNIPCHLDAHPKPTSYRWTFNNSGESVDIPKEHIEGGDYSSTVSYTPRTELDYGTLLCWGTNPVGHQRRPCVFHVFPAGRPDPVHNCSSYNLSETVVNVRCVAGFDGGLPQTFILELHDPHSKMLLANTTNLVPRFSVAGLPSGLALRAQVFSTNVKGRSETASLQVYTIKDLAEKRTAAMKPSPTQGQLSEETSIQPMLAVVLGVLGGLCLVVVLIGVVLRQRYDQRRGQCGGRSGTHHQHRQEDAACTAHSPKAPPTILHDTIPPPTDSPRVTADEKNPDVIPQAECETWKGEGVHTITSTSLPTTYATLPRAYHPCTLSNQQGGEGGGDVVYSELALGSDTSSPQHSLLVAGGGFASLPQHCLSNTPHTVVYATLDHKRKTQLHYSTPPHQLHSMYPPSAPTTPTLHSHSVSSHKLTQHPHSTPKKNSSHLRPDSTSRTANTDEEEVSGPAWTLLLDPRHTQQRQDNYGSDAESVTPLIPNQKESSV